MGSLKVLIYQTENRCIAVLYVYMMFIFFYVIIIESKNKTFVVYYSTRRDY